MRQLGRRLKTVMRISRPRLWGGPIGRAKGDWMIKDLCVVTGGAGFIGSNLVEELGRRGRLAVVIDDFADGTKWANVRHPNIHDLVPWTEASIWLDTHADQVGS